MIGPRDDHAGASAQTLPIAWMDSSNAFEVTSNDGGQTLDCALFSCAVGREMALNLAAWLVALADPSRKDFDRLFADITKDPPNSP